jgi:hypothetical protein
VRGGVQPTPKLGDWVEALAEILGTEANLPKREHRSTQRLFEELRERGYDGAHDSVYRFVKSWRDERARVPALAYVGAPGHGLFEPLRPLLDRITQSRSVCRSMPPILAASSRGTVENCRDRQSLRTCPASFARFVSRRASLLV